MNTRLFFNGLIGHYDQLNMSENHRLQILRISWAELPTVDRAQNFALLGELEQAISILSASVSPHSKYGICVQVESSNSLSQSPEKSDL